MSNISDSPLLESLFEDGRLKTAKAILENKKSLQLLEHLYNELGDKLQENHRTVLARIMGFDTPKISQYKLAAELELTRGRVGAIAGQAIRNLIKAAQVVPVAEPKPSASAELEVFKGETVAQALSWSNMSDEDLRREATRAANARDAEALWGLTEAFLTLYGSKRSKVSTHTLRTYRRGVFDLIDKWANENLLRPSRDAGPQYLLKLETLPYNYREGEPAFYKPETLNAKLAAARTLYKALRWAGVTQADPFGNVRPVYDPVPPEEKRPAYTHDEVVKLVAKASPVDTVLILLCAHGGLRADEASSLTWGQIDFQRAGMNVIGKGNKEQWVGLSDDLLETLEAFYEGQAKTRDVLPFGKARARERLSKLCELAGVEYKGIHSLRHYAGTRLWELHGSLDAPADHLRHANVQTTRRYAKRSRAQRREIARGLTLKRGENE